MYRFLTSGWLFFLALVVPLPAIAQSDDIPQQRYVADIKLETAQELYDMLERANQLVLAGEDLPTIGE